VHSTTCIQQDILLEMMRAYVIRTLQVKIEHSINEKTTQRYPRPSCKANPSNVPVIMTDPPTVCTVIVPLISALYICARRSMMSYKDSTSILGHPSELLQYYYQHLILIYYTNTYALH